VSFALLMRRRRANPVPIYLILMAIQALCFALFFTVQLIYQVTVIGLNPFQMVLVGVVLEVTCVLFEVPTGVVADVYSRRLSVLIGVALMGCSYTLEGGIPAFWAALLSQVFWGLGYTFTSGATEAWITDEIGEQAVGPVFLRGRQMWLLGVLAGTLACVPLGLLHIQLPMLLAGVGMFGLAAALLILMPERRLWPARPAARSAFGQAWATAQEGFRLALERPIVKLIIAISFITGLAAEAWDRLYIPSAINRFDFPSVFGTDSPVTWFALSGVIGTLLGLAASELFRRRRSAALSAGSPARLLAGCAALQSAAIVVFTLSGSLWLAFGMLWLRTMADAVSRPVQLAWLNRNLDAATRATVISMTGQANSVGQVAGGPALGWVGSAYSIRAALLGSALVLTPTIALYRRLIVREDTAAPAAVPATFVRSRTEGQDTL